MSIYIAGIDRSTQVTKGSVKITNSLYATIDTASLELNPGSSRVEGGEEIVIIDNVNAYQITRALSFAGEASSTSGYGLVENDFGAAYLFTQAMNYDTGQNCDSSLEFWVVLPAQDQKAVVLNALAGGIYFSVVVGGADPIASSGRRLGIVNKGPGSRYNFASVTSSDVADGLPHHVAITMRRASTFVWETKVYIDGTLVTMVPFTYSHPVMYSGNTLGLALGARTEFDAVYGGQAYSAIIRGVFYVRVWTRCLTLAEVQANKDKELFGNEAGLYRYTPLWEGGGSEVKEVVQAALLPVPSAQWVTMISGPSFINKRVFAGRVTSVEEVGDKGDVGYSLSCSDYTQDLDRKLVLTEYITTKDGSGGYYPTSDARTWTAGKIVKDLFSKYAPPGFTTYAVEDGPVVDSTAFIYKRLRESLESLAEQTGCVWYIDYYRGAHFFKQESVLAPFSLGPGTFNYKNLRFSVDRTQLRNRVYVRGGSQLIPPGSDPVQAIVGTGVAATVLGLAWEPQALDSSFSVTRDAYPSGTAAYGIHASSVYNMVALVCVNGGVNDGKVKKNLIVGIDGVHSFYDTAGSRTVYEVLVNVEKTPYIKTFSPVALDERVELYYQYKKNILISAEDNDSIAALSALEGGAGVYEYLIDDSNIITFDEARTRANAELKKYASPIVSGSFSTHVPGLRSGQSLHVAVTRTNGKSYSNNYRISEVTAVSDGVGWTYEVKFDVALGDLIKVLSTVTSSAYKVVAATVNDRLDILLTELDVLHPSESITMTTTPWTNPPLKYASGTTLTQDMLNTAASDAQHVAAFLPEVWALCSNLSLFDGSGSLELADLSLPGVYVSTWHDRSPSTSPSYPRRVFKKFNPQHYLSATTNDPGVSYRFYFRFADSLTAAMPDGLGIDPTRWMTFEEARAYDAPYWQLKVEMASYYSNEISAFGVPTFKGFTMDYNASTRAVGEYGQYGSSTYR